MKRKSILVLSIILMSIGFAAVSTTLFLNGNTNVASNTQDFDVYFSKAYENGIENNTLIQDKTHITFTANLKEIDEVYELKYEVTNASKNYDVSVSINVPNGNEYLQVTNDFDTSNLLARTTREGILSLKVIKGVTEEIQFPIEITITVNAVERTTLGSDTIRSETVYKENILNGTDPVLKEELIPVTIADNGSVTYADTHTEWYNYEEKKWANAVILKSGATYEVGDTIPEIDIESYFVWIPKYKYKLFNLGNYTSTISLQPDTSNAQVIEIEFTLEETTDSDNSCQSPKESGESGNCEVGKWMTHPAFQSFQANGFWVGKFETGYKDALSDKEARKNEVNVDKIIIKPDQYAWRYITAKNSFENAYLYKRELNSHMMKNTEWGAVAYLSHSKYGISKKVQINSYYNYKTGYASVVDHTCYNGSTTTPSTCNPFSIDPLQVQLYQTKVGVNASTTGNITGVYDMSGGSMEYVSSFITDKYNSSGFTEKSFKIYNGKYFDLYHKDSTNGTYYYRILGDATGEMGPIYFYQEANGSYYRHSRWYQDNITFISASDSWFVRGGAYYYGSMGSQFTAGCQPGGTNINITYRILLI